MPNYIILILLAFFAITPIVLLFLNSLKQTPEIQQNPFGLPAIPRFSNYIDAWVQGNFSTTVVNTLILTSSTILAVVIIGGLGAFALARFRFAGAQRAQLLPAGGHQCAGAAVHGAPLFHVGTAGAGE